jgi:arabinofuranosyltransferase
VESAERAGRSPGRPDLPFALLLCAAGLGLFVFLAVRRVWINDDAFITFRYAAHIASGHGYVWNLVDPQRIEGSTSLGWTMLAALAMRLFGDPVAFAHLAGLAAGALVLVVVFLGAWRLLGTGPLWALTGVALLCAQRQFVLWSVSGMETSAGALVGLVATLRLIRESRNQDDAAAAPDAVPDKALGWTAALRSGWGSGILFFVGSLLRPEMPLLHLAAGIGLVAGRRTRGAIRLGIVSGLVHAAALGMLTAGRLAYFGQPLPNPFYVKVGVLQWGAGIRFLGEFLVQNRAWPWIVIVLLGFPNVWRRAPVATAVLGCHVLVWSLWLAAIGGDVWEFRMLVPILPMLSLLVASTIASLVIVARRRVFVSVVAAFLVVVLGDSQLQAFREGFRKYDDAFSIEGLARGSEYMWLEGNILAPYLTPQDRICTGWSGAFPYLTEAWHLDPWGLNDRTIARRPLESSRVLYHQRHAEWRDIVANRIVICDLFNHFVFPQAFDTTTTRRVVPWVEPGVPVYSVRLAAGQYWIFTSPLPRSTVESWLAVRGLAVESVKPLPGGWPSLGA